MAETSEFRSVLLNPQEVLKFWPQFEEDIEKALAHSVMDLTAFDICKQALSGIIHIWLTLDTNNKIVCTTTTRFLNYPSYKALQIITCTGKDRKWDEFYEQHKAEQKRKAALLKRIKIAAITIGVICLITIIIL